MAAGEKENRGEYWRRMGAGPTCPIEITLHFTNFEEQSINHKKKNAIILNYRFLQIIISYIFHIGFYKTCMNISKLSVLFQSNIISDN